MRTKLIIALVCVVVATAVVVARAGGVAAASGGSGGSSPIDAGGLAYLSGYWNFDSDYIDSKGSADFSDGGSALTFAAGKVSNAVVKDNIAEYLTGTVAAATGAYAIEFWLKRTESQVAPASLIDADILGAIYLGYPTEYIIAFAGLGSGVSVSNDIWYHVAVIQTGSMLYLYVDGVLTDDAADSSDMYTGWTLFGNGANHFKGLCDEMGYFVGITFDAIRTRQAFVNYWYNGGSGRTYTP